MLVICDTSPLCYLLLINLIEILPQLYGKIIIPEIVRDELLAEKSPQLVQNWIKTPPEWLEVRQNLIKPDQILSQLNVGEREAIALAEELNADLIVLDDKPARLLAQARGLKIIGLLGILGVGAERGLLDFSEAIASLKLTTFRASPSLLEYLLQKYG